MLSVRVGQWQAQEASGLVGDVLEVEQSAAFADDIEQVPMLGRGRISPFSGSTGAGGWPGQAYEHGPPSGVPNITHQPVVALLPPVREIMPAHRLGIFGKLAREIGGGACHVDLLQAWTKSGARHD
jgi:hypothetical protein